MKQPRLLLLLFVILFLGASPVPGKADGWSRELKNSASFIENNGQFELPGNRAPKTSNILFAYDNGSTIIYFTKTGITYCFQKRWREEKKYSTQAEKIAAEQEERKREEREMIKGRSHLEIEREEHKVNFKMDLLNVTLEGASLNSEVIGEDLTSDYHVYSVKDKNGKAKSIRSNAYKKLIYKNIYPDIDIEYTIHPTSGIKYAFVLRSGADISKVKMIYSNLPVIQANGDIHISTAFGDVIDHAPLSFYSNNTSSIIPSEFTVNGNVVSFKIADYDKTRSLTIDPWTQTPTLPNSNCVWECEKDDTGNVYMIGGDSPMKLLKYNSAGVLQWTHNTPYDTAGCWLGTLATDRVGNSYITAGSTAEILKINSAGGLEYNTPGDPMDEYWGIAFNCDQSKLIVGGTRLVIPISGSNGVLFDIDTSSGNVLNTKKVGWMRTGMFFAPQEVRAIAASPNGKCYFLTLDSIAGIDQNFPSAPSTLFNFNSGYALGYKCEDFRYNNTGIMAMKANENFLYTQNGTTVQKRSLLTGSILGSASIPGGSSSVVVGFNVFGNSGIDIDSCGNVYVGSSNAVIKYDSNLVFINSFPTSYKVYDIEVGYGGEVIVCGSTGTSSTSSRVGYIEQIDMSSCNTISNYTPCDISTTDGSIPNEPGELIAYPNPNYGSLTVSSKGNPLVYINIYDVTGKIVLSSNSVGSELIIIDTKKLSTGIYTLEAKTENGLIRNKKISIVK